MNPTHAILVSGWGHPADALAPLAASLAPGISAHAVSLADLLAAAGPPGSDAAPSSGQWPTASPYASALAQCIRAADGQVCLVGWSTGGMVALEACWALGEQVAALVLLSATARFCADHDAAWAVPDASVRLMRAGLRTNPEGVLTDFFTRAALPRAVSSQELGRKIEAALAMGTDVLRHGLDYLRVTDLRSAAAHVAQPCLVVHGDRDEVIDCRAGEQLAQLLAHSSPKVLPGVGHAVVEQSCDAVARHVNEFLEGLP